MNDSSRENNDTSGNVTITSDEAIQMMRNMIVGAHPIGGVENTVIENEVVGPVTSTLLNSLIGSRTNRRLRISTSSMPVFSLSDAQPPYIPFSHNGGVDLAWDSFLSYMVGGDVSLQPALPQLGSILSSLEEGNAYKNVLSDEGHSHVKRREFGEKTPEDVTSCPITMEEFSKGDVIGELPCGHVFGHEAIMMWLEKEKASCPVCRFKLDSVEEKIKKEERSDAGSYLTSLFNQVGVLPNFSGNAVVHGPLDRASFHPSDASYNSTDDASQNAVGYGDILNTFVNHPFGPRGGARGISARHLLRLAESRSALNEERELQEAILASLVPQDTEPTSETGDSSDIDDSD